MNHLLVVLRSGGFCMLEYMLELVVLISDEKVFLKLTDYWTSLYALGIVGLSYLEMGTDYKFYFFLNHKHCFLTVLRTAEFEFKVSPELVFDELLFDEGLAKLILGQSKC